MDKLRTLKNVVPQKWRNRLRALQLRSQAVWRSKKDDGSINRQNEILLLDCRFCGRKSIPHVVLGIPPLTHSGPFQNSEYRLIHCEMCDVIYLDPSPPPQDLDILYQGAPQFSGMHYSGTVEAQRILDGYGRRLDALDLLPGSHESILEVGAGLAWMSRACKERRKSVRAIAQDISKECVDMCPWVDEYLILPIEGLPQRAQFRLVSMTHVIEHISDPARILRQLGVYTVDGGHLYITAPFRPPLWRTEDGFSPWLNYSYLHVPAHISYLSKKWFMEFGPKAGFDLVHWDDSHDGHQVFEAVLRKSSRTLLNKCNT